MHVVSLVLSLIGGIISFVQGGCLMCAGGVASSLAEGADKADMAAMGGGGFLVLCAAICAIVGGIFAVLHKGSAKIVLGVSAGLCVLASFTGYSDAFIWAVVYAVAAFCSYRDVKQSAS